MKDKLSAEQLEMIGKVVTDLENVRRNLLMRRPYSQNVVAERL